MALINCPDCQKQISATATSCVGCSRPIKVPGVSYTEKMSQIQYDLTFVWIMGLALLLIGAGCVWLYKYIIGSYVLFKLSVSILTIN